MCQYDSGAGHRKFVAPYSSWTLRNSPLATSVGSRSLWTDHSSKAQSSISLKAARPSVRRCISAANFSAHLTNRFLPANPPRSCPKSTSPARSHQCFPGIAPPPVRCDLIPMGLAGAGVTSPRRPPGRRTRSAAQSRARRCPSGRDRVASPRSTYQPSRPEEHRHGCACAA